MNSSLERMIQGKTQQAGLSFGVVNHSILCDVHWYNLHLLVVTKISTEMYRFIKDPESLYYSLWSDTSRYVGVQLSGEGAGWSLFGWIVNTAYFKLTLSTLNSQRIKFSSIQTLFTQIFEAKIPFTSKSWTSCISIFVREERFNISVEVRGDSRGSQVVSGPGIKLEKKNIEGSTTLPAWPCQ